MRKVLNHIVVSNAPNFCSSLMSRYRLLHRKVVGKSGAIEKKLLVHHGNSADVRNNSQEYGVISKELPPPC